MTDQLSIALAQINPTVGDISSNIEHIRTARADAARMGADLVVCGELTVSGYPPEDLVLKHAFQAVVKAQVEVLALETADGGPALLIGAPWRLESGLHNAALLLDDGKIAAIRLKHELPNYGVFDEKRVFDAGPLPGPISFRGVRLGVLVCEDMWFDDVAECLQESGAEMLVVLNGSPFETDKLDERLSYAVARVTETNLPLIYVNLVGGQDELVFDGQSFVVRNGDLLHLSEELFEDTFDLVDIMQVKPIESKVYKPEHYERLKHRSPKLKDLLVLCLRDYVVKSGFSKLVLASSGGVDSAVVCKLACEAVGAENVHAIRMPSKFSSLHSREDAIKLHENLGCWDYEMEIDHEPTVQLLNERYRSTAKMLSTDGSENAKLTTGGYNFIADENIQARMRDLYVMHFSNAFGAMPLSTGNKTESACGYYTHFDMNFSFAPIKDLYKYQVVDIAKTYSDIPENIWQKPPSAELAHGQTDEASLLPYAILDPIVRAYVEDYVSTYPEFSIWLKNQLIGKAKVSMDADVLRRWSEQATQAQKDFERIVGLIGRMEYKRRQTCPGTKVSKVAFGIGRRIPIVEKWS